MPKKKLDQYRGRLDATQIAEEINSAVRNARRLAEDAKLLLDAQRYPTAASLAILSVEESGKVSILRDLAISSSQKELTDSWREYRSHTKKNVMGALPGEFAKGARKLDDFSGLFDQDAEYPYILDQLKQIGFYTDCIGRANWSEPSTVVDSDLSTRLVRTAELLTKSEEVTVKEIELWIKHIGPVKGKPVSWGKMALEKWYEDMQAHGLIPEGLNKMRDFIRDGIVDESNDKS